MDLLLFNVCLNLHVRGKKSLLKCMFITYSEFFSINDNVYVVYIHFNVLMECLKCIQWSGE